MKNLTTFQQNLLYVIAAYPGQNGQELATELARYYDTRFNGGRLYPNLDKLAAHGYIDIERHKHDARSNAYRLTDEGQRAIEIHVLWVRNTLARASDISVCQK